MRAIKSVIKNISVLALAIIMALAVVPFGNVYAASKRPSYKYYKAVSSGGIVKAKGYNYKKPVPKNVAVSGSYFNSSAFIGDSRAVDLMIYSPLKNTKAKPYCDIGLNITSVLKKEFVSSKKGKQTVLEALNTNKKSITKVYLAFGLNELGYVSIDTFVSQYLSFIKKIRKINKNMVVYVVSIMPVTQSKDNSSDIYTNKRIKKFNKQIKKMCAANGVYYVNTYSSLCNSCAYLPEKLAYDGIHFKPDCCTKIYSYLSNHTVSYKK